jgi:hypothetical protein
LVLSRSSNVIVLRNVSNVISARQSISFRDDMSTLFYPKTAKIEEFFGIADFFTCHNAQITMKVNQNRDILSHGSIREAGEFATIKL